MTKVTKKQMVLEYLQKGRTLTSEEAWNFFGASRLADIVHKLRKEGYPILTTDTSGKDKFGNKVNFATYKLVRAEG